MDKTQYSNEEWAELKKSYLEEYHDGKEALSQEWAKKAAGLIGETLIDDPSIYLVYGVYWWGVKSALLEYKIQGWWSSAVSDPVIAARADTGNTPDNIAIAIIYSHYNNLQMDSHYCYTLDPTTGEPVSYYLVDEEAGV